MSITHWLHRSSAVCVIQKSNRHTSSNLRPQFGCAGPGIALVLAVPPPCTLAGTGPPCLPLLLCVVLTACVASSRATVSSSREPLPHARRHVRTPGHTSAGGHAAASWCTLLALAVAFSFSFCGRTAPGLPAYVRLDLAFVATMGAAYLAASGGSAASRVLAASSGGQRFDLTVRRGDACTLPPPRRFVCPRWASFMAFRAPGERTGWTMTLSPWHAPPSPPADYKWCPPPPGGGWACLCRPLPRTRTTTSLLPSTCALTLNTPTIVPVAPIGCALRCRLPLLSLWRGLRPCANSKCFSARPRCRAAVSGRGTMSDVPVSSRELSCLICGCSLCSRAGLRTHMLRKHGRLTAQPERLRKPINESHSAAAAAAVSGADGLAPDLRLTSTAGTDLAPSSGVGEGGPGSRGSTSDANNVVAAAGGVALMHNVDGMADDSFVADASTSSGASCGDPANVDARVHATTDAEVRADPADVNNAPLSYGQPSTEDGAGDAEAAGEARYATIAAEVRAYYESRNDWPQSTSLLSLEKTRRASRFNSFRLRELERFTLESCGGSGLTLEDQARLYRLLDVWDGTMPGVPVDEGHEQRLRDAFPTCNSFKVAIRSDIDSAVTDAGWRKVVLVEGGMELVAYFRSALGVVLKSLLDADPDTVKLWSGGEQPAPPSDARETPLDGDAFRMNEQIIVNEHGQHCFVLGLHVFSDASQVSWSGGKRVCLVGWFSG